jgi:hypothetical protein
LAIIASANTNTHGKGAAARGSDKVAVMALEQKLCVIQTEPNHQPVCWGAGIANGPESKRLPSKSGEIVIAFGGNIGMVGSEWRDSLTCGSVRASVVVPGGTWRCRDKLNDAPDTR